MRRRSEIPLDPEQARALALRLLGRREHSAQELRRKLIEHGLPRDQAETLVESLAEHDLQSDLRYAEQLLRSRLAQHYGPRHIEAELRVAGVPDEVFRPLLDDGGIDWGAAARTAWSRKFAAPPQTREERQKQYRYLASHGYEMEHIRQILSGDLDD